MKALPVMHNQLEALVEFDVSILFKREFYLPFMLSNNNIYDNLYELLKDLVLILYINYAKIVLYQRKTLIERYHAYHASKMKEKR